MKELQMGLNLHFAHYPTPMVVGSPAAEAVYQQIKSHAPILKWEDSGTFYIVPGHLLMEMQVARSYTNVETPTDANCK